MEKRTIIKAIQFVKTLLHFLRFCGEFTTHNIRLWLGIILLARYTCKMNHVPFCTVIEICLQTHKLKFVSSKYGLKSGMSNKQKKNNIHAYVYMVNQVDFLKLLSHKSQQSVVANFTPQRFELHYHLLKHVAQCISSDQFTDLKLLNRFIRVHNNSLNITLPAHVIEVTAT